MMAMVIGKIKCCFCEKKGGIFHSVHEHGIYGEIRKRIFYHPECLELIESYPEVYGHRSVDMALHIHDLRKENIKRNNEIIPNFKEKVEKLQQCHFERMMPTKS
jgi:hypothetical protein